MVPDDTRLVALKVPKKILRNTQQQHLVPEVMTRLLKMIHSSCCEQLRVGTTFSLWNDGKYWNSIAILKKTKDIPNLKFITHIESYIHTSIHYILCGGSGKNLWNDHKSDCLASKRAIRSINRADYRQPAKTLFINSQAIKFSEAGDLNLVSMVYTTTCYQTVSK